MKHPAGEALLTKRNTDTAAGEALEYPTNKQAHPHYPHRVILNLRWAHALTSRPDCIPASRPRGAKAAGLRFERALAKQLPTALHGTWFAFEDAQGRGFCQTDIIYSLLPTYIAVIEVKYTLVPGAHSKLSNLYLPIVSMAMQRPTVGVVAVKNLDPRYRRGRIHTDLEEAALHASESGYPSLLQWSGQQLIPPPSKAVRREATLRSPITPIPQVVTN